MSIHSDMRRGGVSLFPEVDEEIKQNRAKDKKLFEVWLSKQKVFTPLGGSEGMRFDGGCDGCRKYGEEISACDIEARYWSGEPCKEIINFGGAIVCVEHTNFNKMGGIRK